ncbi:MAG: cob(I)yrinic acid a,c-diamide adenosyltransferase [Bacteroidales bacterium]|nr:cob(I)yrinic acid a,c-diamide adenosyltransferase [Bacteroidales bacterium]
MRIYTKTGDNGNTSLIGGNRVSKDDIRVETYGTIDELNSWIGLLGCLDATVSYSTFLSQIQRDLFAVGGRFAVNDDSIRQQLPRISPDSIINLEHQIDSITEKLPEIHNFVISGGCIASGYASMARTVCRRAERRAVSTHSCQENDLELKYLNRLSDFLFVFSRWLNIETHTPEKFL